MNSYTKPVPRTLSLFISLYLILSINAQNDSLYALKRIAYPDSSVFVKVDVHTGLYDSIKLFTYVEFTGLNRAAINPYDNTYNTLCRGIMYSGPLSPDSGPYDEDSVESLHLISIDLLTGSTTYMTYLGLEDAQIYGWDFNVSNCSFYFLTRNTQDQCDIYRLDSARNIYQVNSQPLPFEVATIQGDPFQNMTINPFQDQLIVHGYPGIFPNIGARHIYTLDIANGAIVQQDSIPDMDNMHQMIYNQEDSSYYALTVNYTPNERSIVKALSNNWSISPISSNVYDFWYLYDAPAFSTDGDKYFILGFDSVHFSGAAYDLRINTFDLNTGLRTTSNIIPHHIFRIATKRSIPKEKEPDIPTFLQEVINSTCGIQVLVKSNQKYVEVISKEKIDLTLNIYSLNGHRVKTIQLNQQKTTIQLNNLSSGVYILNFSSGQCSETIKILLN